jgi:hypothetical protein
MSAPAAAPDSHRAEIEALIARKLAEPKRWRVVTAYADGRIKNHDTAVIGQAENWAIGERRKIGKKMIDRENGQTVEVIEVRIEPLPQS